MVCRCVFIPRGSHYFLTPEVGGPVDRKRPTQVGRALAHLGVDHIAAYSPHARPIGAGVSDVAGSSGH